MALLASMTALPLPGSSPTGCVPSPSRVPTCWIRLSEHLPGVRGSVAGIDAPELSQATCARVIRVRQATSLPQPTLRTCSQARSVSRSAGAAAIRRA